MAKRKSKKTVTNSTLIYPFPDRITQWELSLQEALEKEFLTKEELDNCLEQGSMAIELLIQIHAKIITYSSHNRLMIMVLWRKIKENIDLSDDVWINSTINPV